MRPRDAVDALVEDERATDGREPLGGDRVGVEDAHDRADGGAGAVGVAAEVHGEADGLREVAAAEEQRRRLEREVHRDVREVGAAVLAEDPLADAGEAEALAAPADRVRDGAREARAPRDLREPGVDRGAQVGGPEERALERGEELLGVDAAAGVVDGGVDAREARRRGGVSGREQRPDLGADRAAEAVDERVVERAGERRRDAALQVAARDAVLVERESDAVQPRVGEVRVGDDAPPLRREEARPDDLQVDVVVRHHVRRHRVVEGERERAAAALPGRAERAADGLAEPRAERFLAVELFFDHGWDGVKV